MNIYQAISAIAADLAEEGVAKTRKVEFGRTKYSFRGVDDAYAALAPLLIKHKVVILPRYVSHKETQWTSDSGNVQFKAIVEAEFDFVMADGELTSTVVGGAAYGLKHTIRTIGEGMDSGDKAVNKAMSNAYKYAVWQTFCVPVEGVAIDCETEDPKVKAAPSGKPLLGRNAPPNNGTGDQFTISILAKKLGLSWDDLVGLIKNVTRISVRTPQEANERLGSDARAAVIEVLKKDLAAMEAEGKE